jgi:hypothetical protein
VDFLKQCLGHALSNLINRSKPVEYKAFKPFKRVLLWDSSGWQLRDKLKNDFKGNGGNASNSGCKVQLCMDVKNLSIVHCELTEQVRNDQSYAGCIPEEVRKDDLVIFDLGYFSIKSLSKIDEQGAFFLTRLNPNVLISVDDKPIELSSYLKKHRQKRIELKALIGKERLECRLVIEKLGKEETKIRRRKLNRRTRSGKKNGKSYKPPSAKRLFLAGWNFFITNAPLNKLPTDKVSSFYRLRWQIELLFKQLKSHLEIDISNHSNAFRLQCEVYSTLIVAVLLSFTHNLLQKELWKKQTECSLEKTFKFLANHAQVLFDLVSNNLEHVTLYEISSLLKRALKYCQKLKQNSRCSSMERIMQN